MNSLESAHTPAEIPAKPAAPNAVVSTIGGRRTETSLRLLWNSISQLFLEAPPSTLSSLMLIWESFSIAFRTSTVPYAIASRAALTRWFLPVPRVIPKIAPFAFGNHLGAPNPTKAGTK